MKIAPINQTISKTSIRKMQSTNQAINNQTNVSFEGKHTGIKLYGGFAGAMSTLASLVAFGISLTSLAIVTATTALGATWGAMLDSEAKAEQEEKNNQFSK